MSPDSLMHGALQALPVPPFGRPAAFDGHERRVPTDTTRWLRLALDEVDHGLLVVSQSGRVLHINHLARLDVADDGHPLQLVGQQLRSRHPDDDGPLRDALADAAERGLRCMLTLGRPPRRTCLAVVPLPPPRTDPEECR